MAFRAGLLLCMFALAWVAESIPSDISIHSWSLPQFSRSHDDSPSTRTCNGLVGDCIDEDQELLMDSEINRRGLYQRKYISYAALAKNRVPCNRRGYSYYNCRPRARANPYRRGCSVITRCKRY